MAHSRFLRCKSIILTPILILSIYMQPAIGMHSMALPYPSFQKGMAYVSWMKDGYQTPASDESLRLMASNGVSSVSIIVTVYQERFNSTEIKSTDRTPSDASLRHVIRRARSCGMNVMLKPHIDLIKEDGNTRGDIGFNAEEKWEEWFRNYRKMISRYARIAQEEGVQFYCVGTELSFASTKTAYWRERIIPAVRQIFNGQIFYAANWDEFDQIQFWGDLDYIGIDAYFPLTESDSPTLEELKQGWRPWSAKIEATQKAAGKPVVFTESGYCSTDSCARKPWEDATSGIPNPQLQAYCYQALLETFWQKPWFYGVYWWNWNTYPGSGGISNNKFTPQNKPAMELVKSWYALPDNRTAPENDASQYIVEREIADRLSADQAVRSSRAMLSAKAIATSGEMANDTLRFEPYRARNID